MNTLHLSVPAIFLLMLTSMNSYAADPQQPPAVADHMGMMGNMTDAQKDQHYRAMQEHSLIMHDLSNQILAEKDPAKKEQLKNQQLDLMKAHHAQMKEHHQGKMKNHP
ncbi:MAG: hypothetical protein HOP02_05780 [Methylococcaceae bacterium]|nr:hypothetical protein [Methylococcaceae bacterium]